MFNGQKHSTITAFPVQQKRTIFFMLQMTFKSVQRTYIWNSACDSFTFISGKFQITLVKSTIGTATRNTNLNIQLTKDAVDVNRINDSRWNLGERQFGQWSWIMTMYVCCWFWQQFDWWSRGPLPEKDANVPFPRVTFQTVFIYSDNSHIVSKYTTKYENEW